MKVAVLIALALVATVTASQKEDRAIIDAIIGALPGDLKGKVNLFKDIAAGLTSGKNPIEIIKGIIKNHAGQIKDLTPITAACKNSILQSLPFVGQACKFIDSNLDKFINAITTRNLQSQKVDRALLDTIISALPGSLKLKVGLFKDIAAGLTSGKNPIEIIKEIIKNHAGQIKDLTPITAACKHSLLQSLPFVGQACKFIDSHLDKIIGAITTRNLQVQKEERFLIDAIISALPGDLKGKVTLFKDVAAALTSGKNPIEIIKTIIKNHAGQIKDLTPITAACKNSILQKLPFVGQACKFIDSNIDKIISAVTTRDLKLQ